MTIWAQHDLFEDKGRVMKRGFTLLELIIVIIIIGVLASLALPKMFKTVEASRATEAIASIATIRAGMERLYLMSNGSYQPSPGVTAFSDFRMIGLEDPGSSPGAHFIYHISCEENGYVLSAQRNTRDGGNTSRYIIMSYNLIPGMCTNYWCGYPSEPGFFWAAHDPYAAVIPSDGRPRSQQKL